MREEIADAGPRPRRGRDPRRGQVRRRSRSSACSPRPGSTLLGENRAQELEAKATAHPEFRWHFIGQLQSRKVKQILPHVELIHSVASDSALRQLERHGDAGDARSCVEVNVAGEEGKAGIAPDELPRLPRALPRCAVAGLMTMPPFAEDPEDSRPHFAAPARARRRARAARALDGHVAGLRGRRRGGCDDRAGRHDALRVELSRETAPCRERLDPTMAFRDSWHRTFVYFGLAEDRDVRTRTTSPTTREPEARARGAATASGRTSAACRSRRRRDEIDDIFADDAPSERRTTRAAPRRRRPATAATAAGRSACTS